MSGSGVNEQGSGGRPNVRPIAPTDAKANRNTGKKRRKFDLKLKLAVVKYAEQNSDMAAARPFDIVMGDVYWPPPTWATVRHTPRGRGLQRR